MESKLRRNPIKRSVITDIQPFHKSTAWLDQYGGYWWKDRDGNFHKASEYSDGHLYCNTLLK